MAVIVCDSVRMFESKLDDTKWPCGRLGKGIGSFEVCYRRANTVMSASDPRKSTAYDSTVSTPIHVAKSCVTTVFLLRKKRQKYELSLNDHLTQLNDNGNI